VVESAISFLEGLRQVGSGNCLFFSVRRGLQGGLYPADPTPPCFCSPFFCLLPLCYTGEPYLAQVAWMGSVRLGGWVHTIRGPRPSPLLAFFFFYHSFLLIVFFPGFRSPGFFFFLPGQYVFFTSLYCWGVLGSFFLGAPILPSPAPASDSFFFFFFLLFQPVRPDGTFRNPLFPLGFGSCSLVAHLIFLSWYIWRGRLGRRTLLRSLFHSKILFKILLRRKS